MVGLAGTLGQVLDLIVLHCDLVTQKLILAFQAMNVRV